MITYKLEFKKKKDDINLMLTRKYQKSAAIPHTVYSCFFLHPSLGAPVAASAVTDADCLSHGSADSSSEVNGEENSVFAPSHDMEDVADNHCSAGTDSQSIGSL